MMSKFKFRKIVVHAVRTKTFHDLIKLKDSQSKVKHIVYDKFEMQKYLKSDALSNYEAKFAFQSRCRMLQVRTNYSQSYKEHFCPICQNKNSKDTQSHLLHCEHLKSLNIVVADLPEYDQLFSNDVKKQVVIVKLLKKFYDKRVKIVEEEKKRRSKK